MNIKIKKVHVTALISYVSKLLQVDDFTYLKIKDGNVTSVVHLPEKDAIKLQQIELKELFTIEEPIDGLVKLAFFNGGKLIDALKHFSGEQVEGEINCAEVGDNEYVAGAFQIFSDDLKVRLVCSDPALGFEEINDDTIKTIFNTEDTKFKFEIDPFHIDKILSLFKLEREVLTFQIVNDKQGVKFKGDAYESLVSTVPPNDTVTESLFYKKYLNLFDKESYDVTVCSNKAVFRSKDANTLLTIATCNQ